MMADNKRICIFASKKAVIGYFFLYLLLWNGYSTTSNITAIFSFSDRYKVMGLTGFDSGQKW